MGAFVRMRSPLVDLLRFFWDKFEIRVNFIILQWENSGGHTLLIYNHRNIAQASGTSTSSTMLIKG